MTSMTTTLIDAWHTVVPRPDDKHGPLSPLLLLLTVVSGLVDSFSYLVLGHVFVVNMTGNVVFLAFALAGAHGFSAVGSLVALAGFVVGSAASGRLVVHFGDGRRSRMLALSGAVELVLVAASALLVGVVVGPGSGSPHVGLLLLLGAAAGIQNGVARKLAVPDLTTTVLTMTITGSAFDSRVGGGPGARLGRRGLSALCLFLGALVGTACVLHVTRPLGLWLAVALLVPVVVLAATLARSRPGWDRAD
jgi:uncharacterized membrane protein YoaK (UPF0700 family)